MQRITVFGKGGIGKSTLSANLAAVYARRGLRVLLVGCDPKHDTTIALTGGKPIRTVVEHAAFMDASAADLSQILVRGRLGVDCVEAGGPEPGIGCAGRGIGRMMTILEAAGVLSDDRYDVALFDVLGDVVCGGFAAPLRQGFADKVVIVSSEELMALYAANNIARAVRNYSDNGVALCGLVANLRDPGADRGAVERLARLIGTRVLGFLPREDAVRQAEYRHVTVCEHAPESAVARAIEGLAAALLAFDRKSVLPPTPLGDEEFHRLSREGFTGASAPAPAPDTSARTEASPAPAAPQATAPAAPVDPKFEEDLSKQISLWEGDPGLNSQVWGAEDQWRRFFCDFETRRHARTHLEVRSPVIDVRHQDLECSYSTPNFGDASLPAFFSFPWPRSQKSASKAKRRGSKAAPGGEIMTNLRDADVIGGGGRKLEEAIGEAVRRAEGGARAVVVHSTCVPTVIGDDATSAVARWRARSSVPIVYSNPAENGGCTDVGLEMFKELGRARRRKRPEQRRVNLVGFPEGPGQDELTGLLERIGLTVGCAVLPALDLDEARRYLDAAAQVFYPNAAYEATYKEFFEPLPLKTLRPPAPYGWSATKAWLKSVAAPFGLGRRADAVFASAAKPLAEAWAAGRAEASPRGLAFVVDPSRLRRLNDPAQTWGVPTVRLLREFGFGVSVLCHGTRRGQGPLSFFETPEELRALLEAGTYQAVYSEYAYDLRLARAGKAQFSLELFEVGLGGALRALERLNGLCRWPFRRRYARYAGAR